MPPSTPHLLVVGALHVDLVVRLTGDHRAAASNPARIDESPGGAGANVARAIAATGVACTLVAPGAVSGVMSEAISGTASALAGIDVIGVPVEGAAAGAAPGRYPGRYIAVLDPNGELVAGYADLAACEAVTAETLLTALPADVPDGLVLDANLSPGALAGLVAAATAPVAALAVSPAKAPRLAPLAHEIALLFCNRREAATLAGLPATALLEALGDGLRDAGFPCWVLTDGAAGVLVRDADGTALLPAPVRDERLRSVNGAGDALAGATLAALATHRARGLVDAVRTAGLAAARAVLVAG